MIACLMLGTTFLKFFNVASSYCDRTFLILKFERCYYTLSQRLNYSCNIKRKEYKIHVAQFKVEKKKLTNFGRADNLWRCNIQNLNHLLILAFELIADLQSLSFKYTPLHPSCFIWVPPNILARLPPYKTSWLLRHINHKQLQLINPSWINNKSTCYTFLL